MARKAPTMTSTARSTSSIPAATGGSGRGPGSNTKPGLTLLEVVIVLVIGTLIIGGTAAVMTFSSDEYALKKAAREIEALAKRARATATLKQIPYALEFSPGLVRLMPLAEALGTAVPADELFVPVEGEEGPPPEAVRWELSLDNGMQARLRRWDSEDWIAIAEGERQLWRFDPDGLCEPIGVGLALEGGQLDMNFNPLTAAISRSTYEAQ